MPSCAPTKWAWGLVPLVFIAILTLAGVMPQVEDKLARRANAALQAADQDWATVSFTGQVGTLRGVAVSQNQRDSALKTVAQVWGVRSVDDRVEVLAVVSPYVWSAALRPKDNQVRLKGHVPSKSDRRTILGIVKASLPGMAIDDRMKLAGGAPARESWLGAISFALAQLSGLKKGAVRLSGTEFRLSGEAATADSYKATMQALNAELPAGLVLKQVAVIPPEAKPFVWTVQRTAGTVMLGGHVPSDAAREQLLKAVTAAFGDLAVTDRMQLASGAPKGWTAAAVLTLNQLARLDSGEATLTGVNLEVKGVAIDEQVAEDTTRRLLLGLPAIYKLESKIGAGLVNPKGIRPKAGYSFGERQMRSHV